MTILSGTCHCNYAPAAADCILRACCFYEALTVWFFISSSRSEPECTSLRQAGAKLALGNFEIIKPACEHKRMKIIDALCNPSLSFTPSPSLLLALSLPIYLSIYLSVYLSLFSFSLSCKSYYGRLRGVALQGRDIESERIRQTVARDDFSKHPQQVQPHMCDRIFLWTRMCGSRPGVSTPQYCYLEYVLMDSGTGLAGSGGLVMI